MLKLALHYINRIYDELDKIWEHSTTHRLVSSVLFLVFVLTLLASVGVHYDYFHLGKWNKIFDNVFFCIEVVFTLLLIFELLSVIFTLPRSVARSVGKQLELLSLIFLRTGFKEFSHISHFSDWEGMELYIIKMLMYGGGAVVIFALLGFNYMMQKHMRITTKNEDEQEFIRFKKLLALMMLVVFVVIGIRDVVILFTDGVYLHSFNDFYTALIFTDIIIILIAIQYKLNYYKIFRYSAFVFATILIRVALSLHFFYDIIIGVAATIFVVGVTFFYSYFLSRISSEIPKKITK